ncbi:MAG: VanZ family protein [Spirochaetales bacterium]|nr:VanZ family protein [Spirochaetales bacterium]
MTESRTLRAIARIALWPLAAVIVIFSIVPDPVRADAIVFLDKLKHLAAYDVLGFVAVAAFASRGNKWKAFALATAACAVLGAGLEILQGFVGRSPDFVDWLCDSTGALSGGGIALLLPWIRARR